MARTFQDDNLMTWEAFASTGKFGYPERSHIVFYCLSDLSRRPRFVEQGNDKAEAERVVETSTSDQLVQLLAGSREAD